ncbi:MAG: 4-hydroxythreonine-4-phosphate dehydrogenase PdxA [Pseudomonadota bacterium]
MGDSGNFAPVAVTIGEPAGIGPEILLKAIQSGSVREGAFGVGPISVWQEVASALGNRVTITSINRPAEARDRRDDTCLPIIDVEGSPTYAPGEIRAEASQAALEAIKTAVALAKTGEASAIVTNPINKDAFASIGFEFPGHTEYLGHLCSNDSYKPKPVMMLASPQLRVVPTTIHIPLSEVPAHLTADLLEQTIKITVGSLRRDFGIEAPRIAVAGLNPHAGENGRLGHEDDTIVRPVVQSLFESGFDVTGPYSADTLFHETARNAYDACICMYHDQALIPIKTIAFDDAVNVTLGLPIIRTSPDHGTALDIAGRGIARPDSLIHAINLAGEMARNRKKVDTRTAHHSRD